MYYTPTHTIVGALTPTLQKWPEGPLSIRVGSPDSGGGGFVGWDATIHPHMQASKGNTPFPPAGIVACGARFGSVSWHYIYQ